MSAAHMATTAPVRSTEQQHADGRVERWDASVGRWREVATGARALSSAPATAAAPANRAAASPLPPGAMPWSKAGGRAMARAYASARNTRTTAGFGSSSNSSADAELATGLTALRSRSRQMVRDSAYAQRAQLIIVNNVVGTGVGMQAQVTTTRQGPATRINDAIESAFEHWACADSCHIGGTLHFHDLERAAMAQVFEAGEIFIRMHYTAPGGSRVPLTLEVIEPERLPPELVDPGTAVTGNEIRMGVEQDAYGRPVAYWVRQQHPGDLRHRLPGVDRYERVPAADMFHLRIVQRWPQSRGVPWLHTVLRKLDDLAEYTQHEVSAARASAAYFATIESPEDGSSLANDEDDTGAQMMDIEPLTIQQLAPGEKLAFHKPDRPNSALDGFVRAMLREVAAGCGASYESLSRDYSQSNYSSSRLALLDDRDLYRTLQQWWIRSFRRPLHAKWLQQAVLAGAVPALSVGAFAAEPERYTAALFKPRGWSWVDPTKEVTAYKEAIKAGLTTLTDVIAATGGGMDIEDVIKTRRRELDMLDQAGIDVDTTVPEPMAPDAPMDTARADQADDGAQAADAEDPQQPTAAPARTARRVVPLTPRTA